MTRDLTPATGSASQAPVARPVLFVELDFPSGFVRLNSSDRTLSFDSDGASPLNEFVGAGRLGSISPAGETSELRATGLEMSLSGIPVEFVSAAFERAQGRPAKVWFGFLDGAYRVVADPALIFAGQIDDTAIALGATATVTVTVENRIIAWERPKVRRYTNEDQQQRFSGDKAFEFVNPTVEKELLWGAGSTAQVPRVQPAAAPAPAPTPTPVRERDPSDGGDRDGGAGSSGGGAGPGDSGSGGLV